MTKNKLNRMSETKGRYFGIEKRDGHRINARLISETPCYVNVYDRNGGHPVKLAKTSIVGLTINGEEIR